MRWVFYSLLVVNLVYLGWQLVSDAVWGGGSSAIIERAGAGESADAPALRLLSEAPQPDRALRPDAPARPGLCPVVGPWSARGEAEREIPVWRMIIADPAKLRRRARRWARACGAQPAS